MRCRERGTGQRGGRGGILLLAAALCGSPLAGYETDQYTNRLQPIADSRAELDREVNQALVALTEEWQGPADRAEFAYRVYARLGGLYWVDRIERRAMKSPSIERLPQRRRQSVFSSAPFWTTRVNFFFGVGDTIRLADSLIGTDKLGHFFSQGFKYFKSHLAGWKESRVLWRGRFNERWIFGQLTTSVYSNADLVANFEGFLFYRSLFEDDVVPGKPAIVRFRDGRAELRREFTWVDHVNDYWDEALNPSYMSPGLARAVRQALLVVCADYHREPAAFAVRDESALRERYADIGLREASENGVPAVCDGESVHRGDDE